jgi:phosphoribosyl-dephospho-CoA transferase
MITDGQGLANQRSWEIPTQTLQNHQSIPEIMLMASKSKGLRHNTVAEKKQLPGLIDLNLMKVQGP